MRKSEEHGLWVRHCRVCHQPALWPWASWWLLYDSVQNTREWIVKFNDLRKGAQYLSIYKRFFLSEGTQTIWESYRHWGNGDMPPHKFRVVCKQFQDAHGPLTLRLIVHEPDALSDQKHVMTDFYWALRQQNTCQHLGYFNFHLSGRNLSNE